MKDVIVVVGPTASGKTSLAIELAKIFNGEVVSADSMQVYKHMDIGTAKPSQEEMEGIKHYLIGEIELDEEFSVAKYKELALKYIKEIISKGKIPIICGGTGLYINSLIYNIEFSESIVDWEYRNSLQKDAEEKGNEYIHQLLMERDSSSANRIHINDTKRIIRALEVFKTTGKTISQQQEVSRLELPKFNFFIVALNMDREILYNRINYRVDKMLEIGLLDEVKSLVEKGYINSKIPMQAIGYKEIIKYLNGYGSLEEAIEVIKMETRRFAKRQLTWFRRLENANWFQIDKEGSGEILKKVQEVLESNRKF